MIGLRDNATSSPTTFNFPINPATDNIPSKPYPRTSFPNTNDGDEDQATTLSWDQIAFSKSALRTGLLK